MGVFQDLFAILTRRKIAVAPTADSLADLIYAIEKRAIAGAVAGSMGDRVNALEARALSAPVAGSVGKYAADIYTLVNTYLASRADGAIYNQALRDMLVANLNASITSRASAADWTSALASKLNTNADAQVSQVPNGVWAAATRTLTALPSVIKSIQHLNDQAIAGGGTTNVAIASVVVAKSLILFRTHGGSASDYRLNFSGSPNSTQVSIVKTSSGATTCSFSVVEFN